MDIWSAGVSEYLLRTWYLGRPAEGIRFPRTGVTDAGCVALNSKCRTSERAVSALNSWAISPVLE